MTFQKRKLHLTSFIWLLISHLSLSTGYSFEIDTTQTNLTFASDSEKVYYYSTRSLQTLAISLNKSLEYALMAWDIADSTGDSYLRAEALNRLGTVYYTYNHYSKAMDYLTEAVNIRVQLHDSVGLSASLVNIGVLYHTMGNLEKAIEYTQKSLNIREKLGLKNSQGAILNNLMVYYTLQGNFQEALMYGKRALDFYSRNSDGAGIADIYVNLGELYYKQNNFTKAYEYYRKAKQHARNIHDVSRIININNSMITVLLDEKRLKDAGLLIKETLPLAENYGELEGLTLLYEQLTRYYEFKQDYARACLFQEKYQVVKDSLQVRQQKDKILQQQAKFNAEFADQQIRTIKQKSLLQELKSENNKRYTSRVSVLFFFLVLLITVLYGFLRMIVKTEKELKQQNLILAETNSKLRQSEEHLQNIIRSKDKFFSIIAHDIINPFQPLLGLSELLVTDIDKLKDNEIKKYARLIHQSANRIFRLLEDLLQWTRSQTDKLTYKPQDFEIKKIIEDTIENCIEQAEKKKIKLAVDIDENLRAFGDIELFKATIRNLVSNAIKFTMPKGKVWITAKPVNSHIKVTVSDTGVGISKERIEKLFRIETISSTKGTDKEEGTGLGLLLCKEFVEKNKGEISVESEVEKGTIFHFTIPGSKE